MPDPNESVDAELRRGLDEHQRGRFAEAEQAYANVLIRQPDHAHALHLLGIIALTTGRLDRAVMLIGKAIASDGSLAAAHNNLGIALSRLNRGAEAIACFDRAIALTPDDAEAHNNRGIALMETKRLADALLAFDSAIALRPDYADAHANRGNLLRRTGETAAALTSLDRAIALRPDDAAIRVNRGNTLMDLLRHDEALAGYEQALVLRPGHAEALTRRGAVLLLMGRAAEALASCDAAVARRPDWAEAHATRASVLARLDRPQQALASYDRAIELDPNDPGPHYGRGQLLRSEGRPDEAVTEFNAALAADRLHGEARLARCMAELPILSRSEAEISQRRPRYIAALDRLVADAEDSEIAASLARSVGVLPFHLPYQNRNDTEPQATFGRLLSRVLAQNFPPAPLPPRPRSSEKIRLGIVSGFFSSHTIVRVHLDGWIREIDRDRFEITGFYTGRAPDAATGQLAGLCDRFEQNAPSNAAWRAMIAEAAPHVLLWPEVGMDPIAAWLAAQRLAPVQCVTFGHPETTGLPTIDYFFSSDPMEPPDGETHYTEKLVRLPGIAMTYAPDEKPAAIDPALFGLNTSVPIYWSGQSLFKYSPRFDWIFPAIAAAVGACQFVFVNALSAALGDIFRERLRAAFAARGLDADRYCVTLSKLSHDQYVGVIGAADVILDPPEWSGCRSTLDSLACDPAIVTLPGRFMRGRHTAAILRQIGCEETIARSLEDYVAIAARLGLDAAWRARVKQATGAGKHLAYDDTSHIRSLENFLDQAVRRL